MKYSCLERAHIKILYADDDDAMRGLVKVVLEQSGQFRVWEYNSGREALNHALEVAPDIILLDVSMPDLSGPQTLMRLRENFSLLSTPVIFITSDIEPDDIMSYYKSGAIAVIPKPFDPETLQEQVLSLWNAHDLAQKYVP